MKTSIGLSHSVAGVVQGAGKCEQCGATIRLGQGLCVSCLFNDGLEREGEASTEVFESVLAEANVPDATFWNVTRPDSCGPADRLSGSQAGRTLPSSWPC